MTVAARVRDGLVASGVGPADRVLVAASAGLDSTVLLRTLVALGQPVVAAHVDHQLRPDSAADGAFVAALAAALGVPCVRLAVTVGTGNVQAEARRARYAALADAARELACPAVATAHTATDQAETVLIALTRGAGLRGLAGTPPARALAPGVRLIRPLLQLTRHEVEITAQAAEWAWREDPSNETEVFHRNRLRHTVLPLLRDESGDAVDRRIAGSALAARAGLELIQDRLTSLTVGPGRVDVAGLRALSDVVRHALLAEAVARWAPDAVRSSAVVGRLVGLLDAAVGCRVEGGGLRAWRERDVLRIETTDAVETEGVLTATPLAEVPARFLPDPDTEVVDADRIGDDVVVRSWQEGDRIRPLGMGGSVLVSDLLRDRGVPRAERPGVPVVVVGGAVAWVVGHRLAAAVAVRDETRRAIRWTWHRGTGEG